MKMGQSCYWRFKGEKAYRYGYPTLAEKRLIRMGLYNGDTSKGPLVDEKDIEVK